MCRTYPQNNQEEKFSVWASDDGEMKDDYAKYYFKSEVESKIGSILKNKPYIKSYTTELVGGGTSDKIDKSISLNDYLSKVGGSTTLEVEFSDGLKDDVSALKIEDLLNDLYSKGVKFTLRVYVDKENIYFFDYQVDDKSKKTSHDKIVKEIESLRDNNRLINGSK